MLRLPFRSPYAPVRVSAVLAAVALIVASACSVDGPIDVDASTVTVQVRDSDNAPVAGAQVTWWPAELSESQASTVGTTGSAGNVTFDVMTLWEDIRIRVSPAAGFAVAESQSNPVNAALLQGVTTVTFRVVAQ